MLQNEQGASLSACSAIRSQATFDPHKTFSISAALRQVSELSSRTVRELTENFSAKPVAQAALAQRQVSAGQRTLGSIRHRCGPIQRVEWAGNRFGDGQYMRVDHCRLQTAMAEQHLDGADVGAGGEQMGGEAVSQTMDAGVFVNADVGVACLNARWMVVSDVCQRANRPLSPEGRSAEDGKTYCQARDAEAVGNLRDRASGIGARPAPRERSARCSSATCSRCRCKGDTSCSGRTVVRSLLPLLLRIESVRVVRSMSLTRKVTHSCTRSPAP